MRNASEPPQTLGATNSCQSTAIIWQPAAQAIGHFAEVSPMKPEESPMTTANAERDYTDVHVLMICYKTTMIAIGASFSTIYGVFIVAMCGYVVHNSRRVMVAIAGRNP